VGECLLVPAYPGSPRSTAVKRLCVRVCVCVCACVHVRVCVCVCVQLDVAEVCQSCVEMLSRPVLVRQLLLVTEQRPTLGVLTCTATVCHSLLYHKKLAIHRTRSALHKPI